MDDIIKGLHDKIKLLNINYKIIVFRNVILKKFKWINFKIYIITYTNKYSFIKKTNTRENALSYKFTLSTMIIYSYICMLTLICVVVVSDCHSFSLRKSHFKH